MVEKFGTNPWHILTDHERDRQYFFDSRDSGSLEKAKVDRLFS